jgi:predicted alpha-1,6-mannanase (GH76 family)
MSRKVTAVATDTPKNSEMSPGSLRKVLSSMQVVLHRRETVDGFRLNCTHHTAAICDADGAVSPTLLKLVQSKQCEDTAGNGFVNMHVSGQGLSV